jgi:hypothetical protein
MSDIDQFSVGPSVRWADGHRPSIAAFAAGALATAPRDTSSQLAEALDAYRKLAKTKPF